MTRILASLACLPEWLVQEPMVMRLPSAYLSMPSGQIEWDRIIMLKLFLFKNWFKLLGPKLTMLFCF